VVRGRPQALTRPGTARTDRTSEIEAQPIASRQFVGRVVTWATEQGIRQFLDLGAGLPTHPPLHETAREIMPTRGSAAGSMEHWAGTLRHQDPCGTWTRPLLRTLCATEFLRSRPETSSLPQLKIVSHVAADA
jgi:S-adenosyl methyltransferase